MTLPLVDHLIVSCESTIFALENKLRLYLLSQSSLFLNAHVIYKREEINLNMATFKVLSSVQFKSSP